MKFDVHFSCGHNEEKVLFGPMAEREKKIAYWEKFGICTACYNERKAMDMAAGCDEVEMLYKDYKNGEYADCKTKPGSYDGEKKTIIVFVPKR